MDAIHVSGKEHMITDTHSRYPAFEKGDEDKEEDKKQERKIINAQYVPYHDLTHLDTKQFYCIYKLNFISP